MPEIEIAVLVVWVAYVVLGLFSIFANAIWLRLSSLMLGTGTIRFLNALHATFVASATLLVLIGILGFGLTYFRASLIDLGNIDSFQFEAYGTNGLESLVFDLSPVSLLYVLAFSLLITANMFSAIVRVGPESQQLKFYQAFAVATLYYAISSAFVGLIAFLLSFVTMSLYNTFAG